MKKIITIINFRNEYFLFLFPLFYVFNRYTENYPLISLGIAANLLLIYTISFILINFLLLVVIKNLRKASLVTFTFMFWFFLFGILHDQLKILLGNIFLTKYTLLLPFIIILVLITILFFIRSSKPFNNLINYINLLLLLLIAIDIFKLVFTSNLPSHNTESSIVKNICDSCQKPDIYLIITDEYAGDKQLQDMFKFENSAFNSELGKRGFHKINTPKSNYNYTPFSVASLLDMNYIEGISEKANDQKNRNISFRIINNNQTINILKQHRYTFVNLSLFDFADIPAPIDNMFFKTRDNLITSHTLFGRIKRDLWFNLITRFKVESTRRNYAMVQVNGNKKLIDDTWNTVEDNPGYPRFIYSHFNMPHYPYTHNRNGRLRSIDTILAGNHNNKQLYLDYLLYTNNQILKLIDQILSKYKKPPVIMLISDHGFREFNQPVDSMYNFNVINHIYLPNRDYSGYPDSLSHVNHFRVFFNKQFNMNLPLLKDSFFLMKEY